VGSKVYFRTSIEFVNPSIYDKLGGKYLIEEFRTEAARQNVISIDLARLKAAFVKR
jgi:hypothetical protein